MTATAIDLIVPSASIDLDLFLHHPLPSPSKHLSSPPLSLSLSFFLSGSYHSFRLNDCTLRIFVSTRIRRTPHDKLNHINKLFTSS